MGTYIQFEDLGGIQWRQPLTSSPTGHAPSSLDSNTTGKSSSNGLKCTRHLTLTVSPDGTGMSYLPTLSMPVLAKSSIV